MGSMAIVGGGPQRAQRSGMGDKNGATTGISFRSLASDGTL